MNVKTFCARFYAELDSNDWGDIDPDLFLEIAIEDEAGWSEGAASLFGCMRAAAEAID